MSDETIRRLLTLRRRFEQLHVEGMRALKSGDYESFGRVIADERKVFKEQAAMMGELRPPAPYRRDSRHRKPSSPAKSN